jgi:hypothetical protein
MLLSMLGSSSITNTILGCAAIVAWPAFQIAFTLMNIGRIGWQSYCPLVL